MGHRIPHARTALYAMALSLVSAAPAGAAIQDIAGVYTGTWTNTTFGSTGAARLEISFAGSTASFVVDVDGNAFGLADPGPVPFGGSIVGGNLVVDATGLIPFGHLQGSIDGTTGATDFTLTMTSRPDILSVDVLGTVAGGGMDLDYTVDIAGFGLASGTLVATLPEPGGASGGLAAALALAAVALRRCR
jgi:hypothetical protein